MPNMDPAHPALSAPDMAAPQPLGPEAPGWPRRHDGWTAPKQRLFLTTLAETGIVYRAAAAAGMSHQSAYALRRRSPAFAAAWSAAVRLAIPVIADIAHRRAIEGQEVEVWYKGECVGTRHHYDNRLLMHMLTHMGKTAMTEDARAAYRDFDGCLDRLADDSDARTAATVSAPAVPPEPEPDPDILPATAPATAQAEMSLKALARLAALRSADPLAPATGPVTGPATGDEDPAPIAASRHFRRAARATATRSEKRLRTG